ncbi:hypothetical protein DPMN_138157 [Dreissena polymorpha]|uniref:Uncharacterized protein n=1 Tax=Dreissena polymorpha TaxID=45954 RepID=A0A9D4JIB4_DREPO|nr:hypothetical protein DPMN_138157 [Dreissena polymorpha]
MFIRSPHDCFTINWIFYSTNTRPLPERFSIHFLLDRYSIFFDMSKNIGVGSPTNADLPDPLTIHADPTRPVPDRLMGLDRVDLIGSGNPALVGKGECMIVRKVLSQD